MTRRTGDKTWEGTFTLHHETDKAMLVSENGDKDDAEWVPLSQIDSIHRAKDTDEVKLVMTEWIAKQKGFV